MLCALAPHLHLSLRVSQPRFLLPAARTASPCALWPTGRRGARAGLGVAVRAGLRRAKQRFYRRSSCLRFLPARAAAFLEAPGRAQRPAGRKRREGCAWWGQKTAPLLLPCAANSLGAPRVPCPKDPSPPSPSPPGSPTHTQAPTCSHFLSPSDLPPSLATSIPAHGANPGPSHLFFSICPSPPNSFSLSFSLPISLPGTCSWERNSRFLPPSQKKNKKGGIFLPAWSRGTFPCLQPPGLIPSCTHPAGRGVPGPGRLQQGVALRGATRFREPPQPPRGSPMGSCPPQHTRGGSSPSSGELPRQEREDFGAMSEQRRGQGGLRGNPRVDPWGKAPRGPRRGVRARPGGTGGGGRH